MSNDIDALAQENIKLRNEVNALKKDIKALTKTVDLHNKKIKEIDTNKADILRYIDKIMRKAEVLIDKNYRSVMTRIINDRQRINTLDNELQRISRRN